MTDSFLAHANELVKAGNAKLFQRCIFDMLVNIGYPGWAGPYPDAQQTLPLLQKWLKQAPCRNDDDITQLIYARAGFHALHKIAGYSALTSLKKALGPLDDPRRLKPQERLKFVIFDHIELPELLSAHQWYEISHTLAIIHAINLLSDPPLTPLALQRFNHQVACLHTWNDADIPIRATDLLNQAAFMSAYATTSDKYDARTFFNKQFLRQLRRLGVKETTPPTTATIAEPHIVIVAENFFTGHAMHRCYANPLAELKSSFRVTLLTDLIFGHQALHEITDRVQAISFQPKDLQNLAKHILQLAPDLIFFPSVGMTAATSLLANMRLARVQVAGIGHPAPIGSKQIDAMAVPHQLSHPNATQLDPLIEYDRHPLLFESYTRHTLPPETHITHPNEIRALVIGINAADQKLNADFLNAIENLVLQCDRPIKLAFFPNTASALHAALEPTLLQQFPGAIIYSRTNFKSYLESLSKCDLILQSFPFGGTNTTTDALALGIPILCMNGVELHSRIDIHILETIGVEADLLAESIDDWTQRALHLIHDDDYRSRLSHACADRFANHVNQSWTEGISLAQALFNYCRSHQKPLAELS